MGGGGDIYLDFCLLAFSSVLRFFWWSYSNSHSLMYLLLLHRSHLDTKTTETSCCCHREELVKTWELSAGQRII